MRYVKTDVLRKANKNVRVYWVVVTEYDQGDGDWSMETKYQVMVESQENR